MHTNLMDSRAQAGEHNRRSQVTVGGSIKLHRTGNGAYLTGPDTKSGHKERPQRQCCAHGPPHNGQTTFSDQPILIERRVVLG